MSKNSAIMKFGEMLTHAANFSAVGAAGPSFAWASPNDIVILGKTPDDINGRVCLVSLPDDEKRRFVRLYRHGNTIKTYYMDDYTGALPSKLCAATRRLRVGAFVDTRVPVKPDVAFLTLESSTLSTKNFSARPIAAEIMNAVPALTIPSAARPMPAARAAFSFVGCVSKAASACVCLCVK